MNKELAKKIDNECEFALKVIAEKYNLKLIPRGGKYTSHDLKIGFIFDEPINIIDKPLHKYSTKPLTDIDIKNGFAQRGVKIKLNTGETAIIVNTKRKKYVIEINGKQYLAPFSICSLS